MNSEASTSGRPFGPPPVANESSGGVSWAQERLGLMKGLSSRALCWSTLTQSTEALINLIAAMVNQVS